jgi:hypothetical protein
VREYQAAVAIEPAYETAWRALGRARSQLN